MHKSTRDLIAKEPVKRYRHLSFLKKAVADPSWRKNTEEGQALRVSFVCRVVEQDLLAAIQTGKFDEKGELNARHWDDCFESDDAESVLSQVMQRLCEPGLKQRLNSWIGRE